MIDPRLVERLHVAVGEALSAQARTAERSGEQELSDADRRQYALSLIRGELDAEHKARLGRAAPVVSAAEEDEVERAVMNRLFGLGKDR